MAEQVQSRKEGVRQRVEIFVADRRKIPQTDAAIHLLPIPFAAVDCDLMAALRETPGKLFGEGLKATVLGRDTARAENGDAHRGYRAATARERLCLSGLRAGEHA